MDPRDRADALLARASARGAFVVTPDNATSPMDASNTQQISRALVNSLDQDPDTTTVLPASLIEENDDRYLSGGQSTDRLEFGGPHRTQPTTPMPTSPMATTPMATTPMAQPQPVEEFTEETHSGLIPTTTQTSGRSNVSRRLDGI